MWITRKSIEGKFPRYLSQRDGYSCSVIAVINYWKYCGLKVSSEDVLFLKRIFRSKKVIGTERCYIEGIMNSKLKYLSWGRFKNHLRYHGPVIIDDGDHAFFVPCFLYRGKTLYILAINYYNGQTYNRFTVNQMKKILKSSRVILCRVE